MLKISKVFIAPLFGIVLTTAISSSVSAESNRLWGQDRYETSAAISKSGWTNSDYVVIASGEGYADALCAAPLAKKYNAPILLTQSGTLSEKTKEEIKRLNAKHIFIIGKYSSVSQNAEKELATIASDIKRLGGNDRYETSVTVAKELGNVEGIVVTSGYGFADALSIAPIAAQQNMPIILTGKEELPEVVKNYIKDRRDSIKNLYVIGGEGVISDAAVQQAAVGAVRITGKDRFDTNLNVMKHFKDKLKFDNLYIVQADGPTGKEFADALSGSALAAKTSSPVILTYKEATSDIESFIKSNSNNKTNINVLGGTAAVSDELVNILQQIVSGTNVALPENPKQVVPPAQGGAATGGAAGSSGSNVENTKEQLKHIAPKLETIESTLKSQNEKDIVSQIRTTIDKVIQDSNYNYKKDADVVKNLYNKLKQDEREDLKNKILDKLNLSDLIELKSKFGL